jgi:hypothetical protein
MNARLAFVVVSALVAVLIGLGAFVTKSQPLIALAPPTAIASILCSSPPE